MEAIRKEINSQNPPVDSSLSLPLANGGFEMKLKIVSVTFMMETTEIGDSSDINDRSF